MKGALNDDDSRNNNAPLMNSFLNSSDPVFKNNLRVLVVDDDKVVRTVTMAMLRTLKVEGKEAVNGKEAVDLYIAGEDFSLVLMDREMPLMTGLEVAVFL
ncbi:putative response regulator and transcription factor RR-A-type family [Dioscorea sansibarensis]